MGVDKYLKEDPERAEAVLKVLTHRFTEYACRSEYDQPMSIEDWMDTQKSFLMDVFRAVRGERD
jgi:hypothetical protein